MTVVDLVAHSESTGEEEEAAVEETEQSTSKHSKRDEDDEVTSKHTSSTDPRPEDIDSGAALDIVPLNSHPPKRPRVDAWNLDTMLDDDDDSE